MDHMTQAQATGASNTYVLLVGVDHYDNFAGDDLEGSVNDVSFLASYCLQTLRVPAANLRVLASPQPTPLAGQAGAATESEVTKGLAWLLEQAQREGTTALLAFSGHGAWSGAGALLCLEDTSQDFTRGVIRLRDLRAAVEKAGARGRFVAMLDCCHVTAPARTPGLKMTTLPVPGMLRGAKVDKEDFDVSDRVMLAARPGMPAYQMCLGQVWHGAMTFALVTTAKRWRASDGMSHGSYKQVLKRAKAVLSALGVPQTLKMTSPTPTWKPIRHAPFPGVSEGYTVKTPDAQQACAQLDPGWFYNIYIGDGTSGATLAQIITMVRANKTVTQSGQRNSFTLLASSYAEQECWWVNTGSTGGGAVSGATYITIQAVATSSTPSLVASVSGSTSVPNDTPPPMFSSPEVATWSGPGSPVIYSGGTNYYFEGTDPADVTFYVQLNVTQSGSTYSITGVQWYLPSAPSSGYFAPATDTGIGPSYTVLEQVTSPDLSSYYSAVSL
jgi:Caspase domain